MTGPLATSQVILTVVNSNLNPKCVSLRQVIIGDPLIAFPAPSIHVVEVGEILLKEKLRAYLVGLVDVCVHDMLEVTGLAPSTEVIE